MPIAPTFGDPTELTIAINLGGAQVGKTAPIAPAPEVLEPPLSSALGNTIAGFIEKLQIGDSQSSTLSILEVVTQSFDAMQSTIARQKLAAYLPEITVTIPRRVCQLLEFDRAQEMIALGYAQASECIPPK